MPARFLDEVVLLRDLPEHGLVRGRTGTVLEPLERDGEHGAVIDFDIDGSGDNADVVLDAKDFVVIVQPKVDKAELDRAAA
jgi:hypothetical protein